MSDQWGPPPAGADIPNYMVLGILSIFCCWPLAIAALVNASKVNKLVAAGDLTGATAASASAKKFAIIAIVLGLIGWGLGIISTIVLFASGAIRT